MLNVNATRWKQGLSFYLENKISLCIMHDACDQSDIMDLFDMKMWLYHYLWYKFYTKLALASKWMNLFALLTNTFLDRIWTISLKGYTILLSIQGARYAINVYETKEKQVFEGKKIKEIRDKEKSVSSRAR